jgi:predicted amino acid racemase
MFLESLVRRNRAFVEAAARLHREGAIPANSYVLDLDAMQANAAIMAREAARLGLKVFAMSKQFGRNPPAFDALKRGGIERYVAVDMACSRVIREAGHKLGHIGHLVQIPRGEAREAAALGADYWTVFTDDKAAEAAAGAHALGRRQDLMARIQAPGDTYYTGHEGGFAADDILAVARRLDALPGARFAGITTFPALLFDNEAGVVRTTPNLATLAHAAGALAKAGFSSVEINAPGTNSSTVFATVAAAGATQVEPGHGLTGTTPLHAVKELPEVPAVLDLTEAAHHHAGHWYCFGGGLYIDPVFPPYPVKALAAGDPAAITNRRFLVKMPPVGSIDYYGRLEVDGAAALATGDTVIFGFRPQIFVTRALVAPVSGIAAGKPRLEGLWTAAGRPAERAAA